MKFLFSIGIALSAISIFTLSVKAQTDCNITIDGKCEAPATGTTSLRPWQYVYVTNPSPCYQFVFNGNPSMSTGTIPRNVTATRLGAIPQEGAYIPVNVWVWNQWSVCYIHQDNLG